MSRGIMKKAEITLSENKLILISLTLIFLYLFVLYHGLDNSCVLIHDNLDGCIAMFKLLATSDVSYFSLNGTIKNVFNGLPVSSFSSGFSFGVLFYLFLNPIIAYILNEIIMRAVAFFGMYLLLKKHILPNEEELPVIAVGVALCFAMLPFWPSGFLSIAGQPLLLYAFLNIIKKKSVWYDWLIIVVFPFYSSLVLAGFAICLMLLIILIYNSARKKINWPGLIALAILSILYLIANYKLLYIFFFDSSFVSHRSEWGSASLTLGPAFIQSAFKSVKNFLGGQYHAASLHTYFVGLSIFIALFCLYKRRKYNNLLFILILSAGLISLFYGFWGMIVRMLPDTVLIRGFQWNRIHYLHPLLWYLAFGLSLSIILRNIKYQKFSLYLISFLLVFQLGYNISSASPVRMTLINNLRHNALANNLRQKLMHRTHPIHKQLTFGEFYSCALFDDIKEYIGKPLESYRVVSIGMHPSIALYNGFYVLDAYISNYPLEYKHKFRKIIEKELSKNERLQKYFDNWGSRCYVFVDELGRKFTVRKDDNIKIKNLELNTKALKDMGGKYIFSAAEIMNYKENNLKFLRVFENDKSQWRIYLYGVGA
jgi:hypothetical protein